MNLWWAPGYNIACFARAGVLVPVGFVLPVEVVAPLMSLSAVVVARNAQLLHRLDLSLNPTKSVTAAAAQN